MRAPPWYCYPFLLFPKTISQSLQRRVELGLTRDPPNLWQLSTGVMRMWHRTLFRSDSIGTCAAGTPRSNWRARLLENRAIRLPCLLIEGAVAPLDLTGLASPKERIIRHLLGAHHDGKQFVFDFELLLAYPGALEELRDQARALCAVDSARTRWLRDLTVYENYHECLLAAVEDVLEHGLQLTEAERQDADLSLAGYLRWCSLQPSSPVQTWFALRNQTLSFHPSPRTSA